VSAVGPRRRRGPTRRRIDRALRRALPGVLLAATAVAAVELGWTAGPRPWPEATGWLRVPPAERPELALAPLWEAPAGEAPELRWLGHSGFVLRWRGTTLLLDPNLSPWVTVARRRQPAPLPAAALGRADAVLISHAHFDHLDRPTLDALRDLGEVLVPSGSERYLAGGPWAARAESVEPWATRTVGALEVTAVPAAHHGNRLHPLRSRERAVGWVIRAGGDAVYFAGDTGPSNDFAAIRDRLHPRVAILPIGAFAPRWPIGLYHLSPEQAAGAAQALGVELTVPCHFGTFRLSLDRPDTALPRFARAAAERGLAWRVPAIASVSRGPAT
jgi:L-ascorbate metabolism protein UlaG (beta-lactamase superfamily)